MIPEWDLVRRGGPPFRHESSYERWGVQQVKMAGAMLVIGGPCC